MDGISLKNVLMGQNEEEVNNTIYEKLIIHVLYNKK